jgi:hypothetical protein
MRLTDDPLGLDPLSPPACRDPRWFVPAHATGISRLTMIASKAPIRSMLTPRITPFATRAPRRTPLVAGSTAHK